MHRWISVPAAAVSMLLFNAAAHAQLESGIPVGEVDLLPLLSRWAHVISAIVLLGGMISIRYIFRPHKGEEPRPESPRLLMALHPLKRWKRAVHVCILVLLLSGFYNFFYLLPQQEEGSPYHMLFGIKVLLALAVFALISILSSTRETRNRLRENSGKWLTVTIALAVVVVLLAGYMKLS